MAKKTSDIKIASEIASKFLKSKKISIRPIGNGVNNLNFLIKTKEKKIVVKLSTPHKEHRALEDYKKEKWCIEKTKLKGIPGPEILDIGEFRERAYMVQTFVSGTNGKKIKDKSHIFHKLGQYAKITHSIKTSGFGERFTKKQGVFDKNWQKFIIYNIRSLTPSDKLIKLGVFSSDQSKQVKIIFQKIKKHKYKFGLNHSDLVSWNTLVEKSGKVNLLDWEFAEAHIVPHFDFIATLRLRYNGSKPSEKEWKELLKGYGMSQKKFESLKPEIYKIALLICVDRLRWAMDRKPHKKWGKYIKAVKKMFKLNLIK